MKNITTFLTMLIFSVPLFAQEERAFETRASYNINGNIMAVGNTLLTCDGTGNCSNVQNGTTSSSNNRDMVLINDDLSSGFSNSSSATLTIPVDANVLYAGLYWGGRAANNDSDRNTVQIKVAGATTYTPVSAITIDTYGADGDDNLRPYQGVADITSLVSNAGSGSYTVGDVTLSTGNDSLGFYGGWAIAVIYQDNNEPLRRLMLLDGAVRVIDDNTETITIPNIITPQAGSFDTFLAALVWEGDQSISGDTLEFEGNPFSDNINGSNNFWNSSISRYDSHVATKSPNYVNQLGMDLDMVDVSGDLPNGLATADIDFVTDGDWYYAHMLMFATDLHVPDFGSTISKTANDINGGDIEAGDVIEYTISFNNSGQDGSTNTVLTDPIPANTTYVNNSLVIASADVGPTGPLTDATGDDAAEFDSNANEVVFRLGAGADQNDGGAFNVNQGATVKFQVTVDNFIQDGDIVNLAEVVSNSVSLPNDDFQAFAQNTITMTDTTAPTAPVCTVTPNPANDGTALTATCSGVETGATLTIPGYVCSAENNNAVTCTATAGENGVDGDETATVEDEAGNTNTAPATFVLDNTAPGNPAITSPADGLTTNNNNPLITGTGEPDSTITVSGPNGQSCTAVVDGSGSWSCTLDVPLQDGQNTITAVASDEAGNESAQDSVTINVQSGSSHNLDINFDGAELVTTEMGGTDTFTVALTLTPTADVTVNLSSSDVGEGTVSPNSLTFTVANWNQVQTVTVTGVDDTEYDLDQDYQIITSALVSSDSNYSGVNPADIDAVNIDDDESPDVSAFLTNCVSGIQPNNPLTYFLTVRNEGNKDISAAAVTAMLGDKVSEPSWICEAFGGASCGSAIGVGDINTNVDLVVGSHAIFTMSTTSTGEILDFIDSTAAIAMPQGETDVDLSNNEGSDSDLIYQFIFKNGFDCAAPGTPQSTDDMLMQILNL